MCLCPSPSSSPPRCKPTNITYTGSEEQCDVTNVQRYASVWVYLLHSDWLWPQQRMTLMFLLIPQQKTTQLPPSGEAAAVVAVVVFRHYHEEKKNLISKD